ncbi:hypothetical protein ACUXST_002477 [Sphingomonas sp. F9_3S_D5_B_2]
MMRKAVWAVLALASCATPRVEQPHHIRPLRPLDVPTIPYVENAAAEELMGSLTYEDACLMFRVEGGERLLPVWPTSSVFNGTSLIFHRPGKTDQPMLVNQEVVIGGNRLPAGYAQSNLGPYLQRCGGIPFFVAEVTPAD